MTSGIGGRADSGRLGRIRYNDKSQALTRSLLGALSKPDYDFTRLGLLFPQNNPSEIVYILDQMSHEKALGTDIFLHIHFIQQTAAVPNFVAEYKYYNNGDVIPASWTVINTNSGSGPVFPWSSGQLLQILPFPAIPAPANENISANLDLKIYRNDNVVTGDVLGKYVDFHYQIDSAGSLEPWAK